VPDACVEGDPDRLKQVLLILLDNALKYTPLGGTVALDGEAGTRYGQTGCAIRVTDTGPGIPSEQRVRIFDRFYRVESARQAGGAGLGLAIARWIAQEHAGALELDDAPGGGSRFTLWLPTSLET
jgi:signal transduction histidine kinase